MKNGQKNFLQSVSDKQEKERKKTAKAIIANLFKLHPNAKKYPIQISRTSLKKDGFRNIAVS